MKLQRKSLALMIGIACSGLLYGINANATAVEGFDNEGTSLTSISNTLKQGTSLEASATNLSVDATTKAAITTGVKAGVMGAIDKFDDYQKAVEKNNTMNNDWYTAFHDYLETTDEKNEAGGLLGKLSANLKGSSPTLTHLSIGADGKVDTHSDTPVTAKEQASETLLTLIELGQKARQEDKDKKDDKNTAFNAFLSSNSANLRVLGVSKDSNGTEVLETGAAKETFLHFVDDMKIKVNGENVFVPVEQIRENLNFLKNAKVTLVDNGSSIATKVVMDVQDNTGNSIIVGPDSSAKLSTVATLDSNLQDGNEVIVASKGTKVSIKGNEITYDKKTYNNDSEQSLVFLNGKFNKLGVVDISNSNIQGASNTVVAKSEAIVKDGKLVNPADGITAYGNHNTIESNGIAIGNDNTVGGNGTVIGNNSIASGNNAIAVGNKAIAAGKNSIALGSNSLAKRDNEINVGMWKLVGENETTGEKEYAPDGTRIIGGVADGTQANDAVNRSQLDAAKKASEDDATKKAGNALSDSKLYTNEKIETAGTAANTYTDKQVSGLKQEMNGKIDALDKKVNKGFAANAALSGLFQPYGVGKINMTAGVGGYQSESAVAVGVGYRVNENVAIKGGIATAVGNGSSTMYNASVNFEW